jgi:hypothetical protein
MTGLKLMSAAAILSGAVATPAMAQEATQEPGALGRSDASICRLPHRWLWRARHLARAVRQL